MPELAAPVIFYHLWPCEGWQVVHKAIFGEIGASGLFDACEKIHVGYAANRDTLTDQVADDIACCLDKDKFKVHILAHEFNELPTQRILHDAAEAATQRTPFLYLHCRSARRRPGDFGYQPALDHNALMIHFNITKWRECVEHMRAGVEVVGCEIQEWPNLHISGNFWWATTTALKTLRKPPVRTCDTEEEWFRDRGSAESWIGGIARRKMFCMHNSPRVDHYHELYPRERYADA